MVLSGISLQGELQQYFGFKNFKGNQEKIISTVLAGKDAFVIMPTGGGKSLCYQLPALMSDGTAIVISPLIALMKNQVDLIRSYSKDDSVAHYLNSSLNKTQSTQVKKDLVDGKTKILYVAPESLVKQENIDFLKSVKISFLAIDEAHCISEWGHDFRPEYRRIKTMIDGIDEHIPIIALTATATPKVQSDIIKTLKMSDPKIFISSFLRENLYYEVRPKLGKDATVKDLIRFIKHPDTGRSGIIYCLSRKRTEEIADVLKVNGINAAPYHAGLDAQTRSQTQDAFLMEDLDVIVATIAFGMGIDKPDVRFVVHFDIPKSLENYYQETGRAGRDGLDGKCIAYFSYKDINKLEKFMRDKPVAEKEIGGQHIMEVVAYAESGECRKQFVLHYFGETDAPSSCGNKCDNCNNPKEKVEGQDDVMLLLNLVKEVNEKCTIPYLVNILLGKRTGDIEAYSYNKLQAFGKGKAKDDIYWNSVIRKAMLLNLIRKDVEEYGIIKLEESAQDFLMNPRSVPIVLNTRYALNEQEEGYALNADKKTNALDATLFTLLKDLRKEEAARKKLPPYVIFQDPSLEDMATNYPITMEEMGNISGVSKGKAIRYGRAFIELIANYVEENDIERPADMVVKSMVNKSGQKVAIIQSIDKKMPLEDIADAKGMSMDLLIEELESIVSSGTKVDLSYYIDEIIDEDVQEIIFDYFMEADSDSVEEAFAELQEEDIELQEIKLVRIKFLSELAN